MSLHHVSFSLPSPGATLAHRYELGRVLGEGASSVVFAARDLTLHREVAVKVLKPQSLASGPAHQARFLHEARTVASLAHPHVVTTYDFVQSDDGITFLVMELVTAGTLEAELEAKGALDPTTALRLLLPLMGALACAHDRGIVHRDLKPANIVLERSAGGATRAKLLDFGIAKIEHGNTTSGVILGTPAYMAPEQASAGELGPFTDVWAMGVVLMRCLSGRLPFEAPTPTALLLQICQKRAPRMRALCPALAPSLAVAIDRALEPRASARYVDMRELARAIAAACTTDGIEVPLDPDPIGLPLFCEWLRVPSVAATARIDNHHNAAHGDGSPKDPAGSVASSTAETHALTVPSVATLESTRSAVGGLEATPAPVGSLESTPSVVGLESTASAAPRRRAAWQTKAWVAALALAASGLALSSSNRADSARPRTQLAAPTERVDERASVVQPAALVAPTAAQAGPDGANAAGPADDVAQPADPHVAAPLAGAPKRAVSRAIAAPAAPSLKRARRAAPSQTAADTVAEPPADPGTQAPASTLLMREWQP